MQSASSRLYTVLLAILTLILLCILLFVIFGGGSAAAVEYAARQDVFAWPQAPRLAGEINVNTADAKTLSLLPGIGEVLAQRIIEEREKNGPFHFPGELLFVYGIGEKKLAALLPHIRLDDGPQ